MLKRIAIAIVVLPVSFAILWAALAIIAFLIGSIGSSLADAFQITLTSLSQKPGALPQSAQTAWAALMQQYAQNSSAISQLISADSQHFGSFCEPPLFPWITVVSALGAIIFALSQVTDGLNRGLLLPRKWLTGAIVWSSSLALIFSLVALLVFSLADFMVGFSAGFTPPTTTTFSTVAQAKAQVQKPVSDAVISFDTQYGVLITLVSLLLAVIMATYMTSKLVGSEKLPWCRYIVPARTASGYRVPES